MTIKIYCDGGAIQPRKKGDPLGRGYSCILQDGQQPIVLVFPHCTNNEAEYRAILAAVLKVMIERIDEPVEIHTDCQHFLSFYDGTFKKWTAPHLKELFDSIKGTVQQVSKQLSIPITFHNVSGLLNPAHRKNW